MDYLIGLDVGTTNMKALVIDAHGRQAACCRRTSGFSEWQGHQVVFAEQYWRGLCDLLANTVAEMRRRGADPARVRGIAVASMGEMGFPVGEADALFPAISWYDPCTEPFARQLRERLGEEGQIARLGQRLLHIFSVSKLMWLKAAHPRVYDGMATWLCMADYAAFRLCGSRCMDLSLAARTGMLDWRARTWSEPVVQAAGLDAQKLPKLVQGGARLGTLLPEVAGITGLPAGLPVAAGGHDHVCESFACGAGRPGILMNSSGTTEALVLAETDERRLEAAGRAGYNIGPHARPGIDYIMAGILASGASVDWYRDHFGDVPPRAGEIGSLTFLPHLRGSSSPTRDLTSKGAFLGITDRHDASDMMQAVYEGLALELRCVAEGIAGGVPDRVIGVGGGYMNAAWAQLKADVMERKIEVPESREATALGAAMLAGVGCGLYSGADEAFEAVWRSGARYVPDPAHRAYYREKLAIFRGLYDGLLPINAALSRLNH